MVQLDNKQVQIINDLLVEQGITYEALHTDLLDHMCCMVEENMDNGLDFGQSLTLSVSKFGISNIYQIQENTIYLLTLKLNKMKKTVGISGIISALFVMMGVLFKIQHWPGAGVLLVCGLVLTALFVFPAMAYLDAKAGQSNLYKVHSISGYVSAILLSLATLVKIMHWPGFSMLYYSGAFLLLLVFLPLHTWKNYKIAENKLLAFAKSLLIIAGVIVFWGLLHLR